MKISLMMAKKRALPLLFAFAMLFSSSSSNVLAGDPFRGKQTRPIGEKAQAAFEAVFKQGNYPQAKVYLQQAEQNEAEEPLVHAMAASLAYIEKDWDALRNNALQTLETAHNLKNQDPLRGNLYLAVGHFLSGAYQYKQDENIVGAIAKLQKVFAHIDAAEKIDPTDPELNLLKGYLELMLAVNLPFSSPEEAIEQLQTAAPAYLVNRGIAVAYRDLKQYNQAIDFVERSLQATPENPDIYYLKGQILRKKGKAEENLALVQQAITNYDIALKKVDQLPQATVKSLQRERRKADEWIEERE